MPVQRWEKAETGRYYLAVLQQNLLGEWEVMRIWGGKGSARGGFQCVPASDQAAALLALSDTAKRRAQRGYLKVGDVSLEQGST